MYLILLVFLVGTINLLVLNVQVQVIIPIYQNWIECVKTTIYLYNMYYFNIFIQTLNTI